MRTRPPRVTAKPELLSSKGARPPLAQWLAPSPANQGLSRDKASFRDFAHAIDFAICHRPFGISYRRTRWRPYRTVLPFIALVLLSWSAASLALAQTTATNLPPGIQDVIKLTRSGMTEEVILAELKTAGVSYHLTADQLIFLSNEGVSQNVLNALIQHEEPGPAATPNRPSIPPSGAPPAWARALLPGSLDRIRELLAPYGTWVEAPPYGSCWRPTAATADANWRPYTQQGHWLYTEAGWFWHSDYSWGHIAFHFGRWFRDKGSWLWAPGDEWAPAWVCWREAEGYLGWGPLPPAAAFKPGVGLEFDGAPAADSAFGLGPEAFTFVPCDHFWDRNLAAAVLTPDRAAEVFKTSAVKNGYGSVNGIFSVEGVGRERVATLTHREVKVETPLPSNLRPLPHEETGQGAPNGAKGQPSR